MAAISFPFSILVLAPFATGLEHVSRTRIVTIADRDIDQTIQDLSPTISVQVPKELWPEGIISVVITRQKDFRPSEIVKNCSALKILSEAEAYLREATSSGVTEFQMADDLRGRFSLVPLDLSLARAEAGESPAPAASSGSLDDLFSMVAMPGSGSSSVPAGASAVKTWLAQIESTQRELLTLLYRDEGFRSVESVWNGIKTMVQQGLDKDGFPVQIRCASFSEEHLSKTLDNIVTELADDPPSLVLVDQSFSTTPISLERLETIAEFADAMMVPTVVWLTPSFLYLDSWAALSKVHYLKHYLEDMMFAKWRSLSKHPGCAWMMIACNRFLTRPAYGKDNLPRPVLFEEKDPPWVSPVYAIGSLVARSVASFGWPTRLTDYRNVFLHDLAVAQDDDEDAGRSTEMLVSEDRAEQFVESGITPLMGSKGHDRAFLFREGTISGASMKFQFFFNRIIGYLMKLRDAMADQAGTEAEDPADMVRRSLAAFFEATGHESPDDLTVEALSPDEGGTILAISMTPPRTLLTQSSPIQFTFAW